MRRILGKLNKLLDAKQKRTMLLICFMMIIGAFLQTLGVSLLVGVVNVVIDPEAVRKSDTVRGFYELLGMEDFRAFSLLMMTLLIVIYILKNAYLYLQQKAMYAFVYTNQFRTSERMMRNYLRRGYEYYLNADTAVVQRSITSDVNNMYALILALLQMVSDGVVSICVVAYCLKQSGVMTILLAVAILLLMLVVKKVLKPVMYRAGKENQDYYSGLFKWISQTVQGIKEVKIFGKEQYFVDRYCDCGQGYVNAVQHYSLYNSVPKLLMETVCVITMVGYMMVLIGTGSSTENMLSVFATLAAAAVVLLPAVNRINNQLNSMAYFEPFLMNVSDNLQDEISEGKVDMSFADPKSERMPISKEIRLENITYAYPGTDVKIFDRASLTVPIGSSVGIVGSSGAGKSTIVDILLGLLVPQEGTIYADDHDTKEEYRRFLKNIGYIPQMIFMLDDSIRSNVAFGVPEEEISEERIWEVLREAQLDEFVRGLPEGLDTGIGERGIRLSGGQRQRIGIARALYHDPEILVLDEATSALDNDTEKAIMDSINHFRGKKTLIIIAHRLQTIEKCDSVFRVENGRIEPA